MLPLNPARIPALFQEALKLQGSGRLDAARDAYARILSVRPDLAEAHFQLGRIALLRKTPEDAAGHFDRAAALKPGEPAIWQGYAEAVRQMDDKRAADRMLAKAKAARLPNDLFLKLQQALGVGRARTKTSAGGAPPTEIQKAIAAIQRGGFDAAAGIAARLLKDHPKVAILHDILAVAEAARGRSTEAEAAWKTAIRLDPGYAEAHAKYGRFLAEKGDVARAVPILNTALELAPGLADARAALGTALLQEGRAGDAIAHLRRSLKAADHPATRIALARALSDQWDHDGAIAVLEPLRGTRPTDPDMLDVLTGALGALQRNDEALALYDAALEGEAPPVSLIVGKALFLQRLARFDEAEDLFRQAIARAPGNGDTYRLFLTGKKLRPGDPLIAEMERIWEKGDLAPESRASLGFALAKALEDTKQHDRVFAYLRPANDLVRRQQPYDIAKRHAEVDRLIAAFDTVDFGRTVSGTTGFAPIFVSGLPRSGTTLIEQVLASHSRVTGGGEMGNARRAATRAIFNADGTLRSMDDMPDPEIAAIGTETEREMRALFPDADRITDKGVQSYNLFGPIRLALPNARFVLVERDPRDSALSMYRNLFSARRHLYCYSLSDLGGYYRAFRRMVAFWQAKLPGQIHVVRYESFLDDPEGETRRLLAHSGLDWEDACLNFHENTRRVDTLSLAQVRQPLYKTSMQAWRHYEDELGALMEAIGDAMPEEYRDGT